MAIRSLSATYKNCEVSISDMTITEVSKDDVSVFNIIDILKVWDGEDGVDITFKKSSNIVPEDGEDEEG